MICIQLQTREQSVVDSILSWFCAGDSKTVTLGYTPDGAICCGFRTSLRGGYDDRRSFQRAMSHWGKVQRSIWS